MGMGTQFISGVPGSGCPGKFRYEPLLAEILTSNGERTAAPKCLLGQPKMLSGGIFHIASSATPGYNADWSCKCTP